MISAGDFRNGITLEIDGQVVQILEFQHVKPGKGAAFVRTKLKNVINGGVVERTFRPTEKFPAARIDRVDMQYLYADGDLYNFMDVNTYEQIALSTDVVGDALKFVKENETVKVCSYNGKVFSVRSGLGPTTAISPLKIFQSCGSSSNRHFRSTLPTRVMRSSSLFASCGPCSSALQTMLRNL